MKTHGSVFMTRTWSDVPSKSRRRCPCCKRRATHFGLGGGVVLMMGCEWYVRRWCKMGIEVMK